MGTPKRIMMYDEYPTPDGTEWVEVDDGGDTPYRMSSQSMGDRFRGTRGANIASAATTDLGAATGFMVHVTGSTGPITSLGSTTPGKMCLVVFDSTPTLTYHATNLVLPGSANIVAVAGDAALFECEGDGAGGAGSRWKCVMYQRADGTPLKAGALTVTDHSANYTFVAADANTAHRHPTADATARIWTIPANSSVPYPIGTMLTGLVQNGSGAITLSITSDTLRWSPAGTSGSRTIAANGMFTAVKVDTTEWLVSGTGIT